MFECNLSIISIVLVDLIEQLNASGNKKQNFHCFYSKISHHYITEIYFVEDEVFKLCFENLEIFLQQDVFQNGAKIILTPQQLTVTGLHFKGSF